MNDAKTAELKYLYVNKEFRKQGLGEDLTRAALKFARMKKANKMILWSDTRFIKAHRLHKRMGFEKIGERKPDDLNDSKEFGFKLNI